MGFRLRRPKLCQLLKIIKTRDVHFPLNTCVGTTAKRWAMFNQGIRKERLRPSQEHEEWRHHTALGMKRGIWSWWWCSLQRKPKRQQVPQTRPGIKGLLQLHGHRTWVSGASPYVTESCTKQGPGNHPNGRKDRGDVKIAFSKFFQSPLCEPWSHWA